MRFIRIQADGENPPPGLSAAALSGQLELVQLDYHQPHSAPAASAAPPELAEFATSFPAAVRELAQPLFLDADLTIITSAGWSNSYACVEAAGKALVESGCGDLAVSAVRGSNVLPILDTLEGAGLSLSNAETGAPWKDLQGMSLLAANLQIGAGPFATALGEGARLIVAGNYDPASPATAATVRKYGWSWTDSKKLAAAATAARAAAWHGQARLRDPLSGPSSASSVEIDADGRITVERKLTIEEPDAAALTRWLRGKGDHDESLVHADVRCRARNVAVTVAGSHGLRISGLDAQPSDGQWRLEVVVMAGYLVETILEVAYEFDEAWRQKLVAVLRDECIDPDNPAEELSARELGSIDGSDDVSWVHLTCRTSRWQGCRRFVDELAAIVAAHRDLLRLPAGAPTIFVRGESWPTRVPRDAVDLAIDTRLAKEWI